jgi:hypothetical protein
MKRLLVSISLLVGLSSSTVARADEPIPAPARAVAATDMERRIERAIALLGAEPSLADLERAALRLADADVDGADGWSSATNWSAVLPVVKVVAEHDMERDESLDRYQDEPDRWGADTDRDLGLQVSAQWNLPELIFNPDEVRVYSALANRASRREAVLTTLVGYYFERRRLQLAELLEPAADLASALERRMRIEELTAFIDALTGGRLSSTLKSAQTRARR